MSNFISILFCYRERDRKSSLKWKPTGFVLGSSFLESSIHPTKARLDTLKIYNILDRL
ncbi:hypothetical protein FH581_013510 [Leptospira weilii]|uniref:hypothetical protein n=1 Tax=Leptospira weilii TaxID=28184 RepID=UPI000ADE4A0A|nr:hypothetical protein [Leptospira weilii]UPY76954.1 hypothetical protein FH581_013510 [Leptospira weilii]